MVTWQLQPPQQRCSAPRQPAALLCNLKTQRQTVTAHRRLQQHRRSHRSLEAVPARFENGSHLAYYEPPVAGSRKEKVASRIKAQRQRLKELQRETADQDGRVSHAQWSHLVQELREMSGNLSDVAKMAASSSSSSENEDTGSGAAAAQRISRTLPQLPALARLAETAPDALAAVQSAAAPAAPQGRSLGPAGSPASALRDAPAARAATVAVRAAGGLAAGPLESELAAVLRGHDHPDAAPPAGAALLSAATSLAAGRDAHPECSPSQQRAVDAAGPASNIVAAPQAAAARVQVCQGKSCARRGAADLLRQASAAGGGRPGVEVSGCKCLGECKRGPAVRVRTGRERPTVLTQVAADGGAELAGLMEREMLRAERTARGQPQDAAVTEHPDAQKQLLGC